MGTIFEIFDSRGNVTRRGSVGDAGLNVDIRDGDVRYEIRDEETGEVHSQGYTRKSITPKSDSLCAAVLKEEYGELEIFLNGFKRGHNTLICQDIDKPDQKLEQDLMSSRVKIRLDPGEYSIMTRNETETSAPTKIRVSGETSYDLMERAYRNIESKNEKHLELLERAKQYVDAEGMSPYEASILVYLETEDDGQVEAYDVVYQLERIMNAKVQLNNRKIAVTVETAPQGLLRVSDEIMAALIYRVEGTKETMLFKLDTSRTKEQAILLEEGRAYRIDLYEKDDLVHAFSIFSSRSETKTKLWERSQADSRIKEEAEEKKFLLFNSQTNLTEEDKETLAIKAFKKPPYAIFRAPETTIEEDTVIVTVKDYEALKRLDKAIYFLIKETSSVFSSMKAIRILITGESFSIPLGETGVFPDKEYMTWLEDEDQRILTSARMASSDLESAESHNEAGRRFLIRQYESRLNGSLAARFPEDRKIISEEIDQIMAVSEITPENISFALIPRLSKLKDLRHFNMLSSAILEDEFSSALISDRFFHEPVRLSREKGLILFPTQAEAYLICINSFRIGDLEATSRYLTINGGYVSLEESDYHIVSVIDKRDYSRTGFIYFNTLKRDALMVNWKIDVEVI